MFCTIFFVDPVPREILNEHRRNPGVPGHQDAHGRNVTEDEPAAAICDNISQFRDLSLLEGQEGVKPRCCFCKIDLERAFLNKTDIGEKRAIGESA